jgi:hypothetical protein
LFAVIRCGLIRLTVSYMSMALISDQKACDVCCLLFFCDKAVEEASLALVHFTLGNENYIHKKITKYGFFYHVDNARNLPYSSCIPSKIVTFQITI